MKINNRNLTSRWVAWLVSASVLLVVRAQALDVIDPTGVNYTGVSDSTEYSGNYSSTNLFDNDMTGIPVGTILSDNTQYATRSQTNAFVAFQLDKVYTNVGSIFYAQRSGAIPTEDKMNVCSIWASASTPFAAADPGTPPDSVVTLTNLTASQWTEYLLTNIISGQYFLLELTQTRGSGNPGGSEFRLGANLRIPTTIATMSNKTVYVGGTARLGATVNGSLPIGYTWSFEGNPLNNGGVISISGADTANLIISNVTLADSGDYTLTATNAFGTATESVNVSVLNAPTNAETAAIIADYPMAFWQLNESSITMPAFDFVGTFNGTYGPDSIVGVAGPQPPAFPGFSTTNTALQTTAFDLNSPVTVPAMNISPTNSVTLLAWIYPDDSFGLQQPYTGLVFCRGAGTVAGLICSSDGAELGYQWKGTRYQFDSGLTLPSNQWTMVALVYRTNYTTLYLGTTNGIVLSAVDNYAQGGQSFAAPMKIGMDTDVGESTRTFNGLIDDVAFFNRALSSDEIQLIYQSGTGLASPPTIGTMSNKTVYVGGTARLSATVNGSPQIGYTWSFGGKPLNNGGGISGADTADLIISNVALADGGDYTLTVTNAFGTATASVNLTVLNVPTNAETAAIIADHPMAFWQLNESSITMPAFDYVGSFNGTYGSDSIVGEAGPQPPAFPGFSSTNTALQTTGYDSNSPVTVPAMNISATDSVTILAWIYPDDSFGLQQPYTGIVFCRGAGTAAGLICDAGGTNLAYQWAGTRYQFDSGLMLPSNQWTMVALVYRTNYTTLYIGTTNGLVLPAVDNTAQVGQSFEAPMRIGMDTDVGESTRTFNGLIDDVAFFDRALSSDEVNLIYQAGTGLIAPLQILSQTATNITLFQGGSATMLVEVSGVGVYQWYDQNAAIAGATNNFYTISNAKVSDSGNYYLVVTNNNESVVSAVFSVTVPSYLPLPIDPTEVKYTGISASSEYSSVYSPVNLFDNDMTGIPMGTILPDDTQYAAAGTNIAFVTFQLDKVYTNVDAIFYSQRSDQMNVCSIWASASTPFAAADPETPPDSVVALRNLTANQWTGYLLTNTISGQYFLVELAQTNGVGANPGGDEFRLGATVTPVPLTFSTSPTGLILNWPSVATLQEADNVNGPWTTATGVTSGVPIPMTAAQKFYRVVF